MDEGRLRDLVRSRSGIQGHMLEQGDIDRFVATIRRLPDPPASVLDVGCGTGVLADVAADMGYDSLGIDSDEAVMEAMSRPHLVASIDEIPAADRAFDVVVLNEVLEHLPVGVFTKAIAEVARVSRHRIVVTVPNAESLESASTRCPMCGCVYSIHGHVRRFERSDLESLFPEFQNTHLDPVGPYKLRHRSVEWYIRRRLLGRWPHQPGATCPQCQFQQEGSRVSGAAVSSPLVRLAKLAYAVPWHRWWLVAAYERRDGTT